MNFIIDAISIVIQTVNTLLPPLVKAMILFKNLLDGLKEQIVAAGLGVPVIVVSIGSGIAGTIALIIKINKFN